MADRSSKLDELNHETMSDAEHAAAEKLLHDLPIKTVTNCMGIEYA